MIPLLTPEAVKEGSSRQAREQAFRVNGLADEENRLVISINKLRKDEKEAQERFDEIMEENQPRLAVRRTVLVVEVEALEERKRVALIPVKDIEQEAARVLAENTAQSARLAERANTLSEGEKKLIEATNASRVRSQALDEREHTLDARERDIATGEEEVARSADELAGKWAAYHAASGPLEDRAREVEAREAAEKVREDANVAYKAELDKQAAAQNDKDREIADKYAQLAKTTEEVSKAS